MIKPDIAIDKAVAFLTALKPEYLGAAPEGIRLETIQLFDKEWVVVLSYSIPRVQPDEENLTNAFLKALSSRRYVKEFDVDSETGIVRGMRNPQAPATAGNLLTA